MSRALKILGTALYLGLVAAVCAATSGPLGLFASFCAGYWAGHRCAAVWLLEGTP